MKKILVVFLSMLFLLSAAVACNSTPSTDSNSESTPITDSNSDSTGNPSQTEKTYTVTLNANGGQVSVTTITVTYNENYTLPTPTHDIDHTFMGWKLGDQEIPLEGKWTWDVEESITLIASWKDVNWTPNY